MRDIKFRGLTKHGTWLYGDLVQYRNETKAIIGKQLSASGYLSVEGARVTLVRCETIGQFAGLKDKNGVEIYEGDIVRMSDDNEIAEVKFVQGAFRFIGNGISWAYYRDSCKVLGNIHQNQELLEVKS